jgi:hypothetical protein
VVRFAKDKKKLISLFFFNGETQIRINNVASPVVCLSVVKPLVNELGADNTFAKTLLLALAYANNIGGMTVASFFISCYFQSFFLTFLVHRVQLVLHKIWWLFKLFKGRHGKLMTSQCVEQSVGVRRTEQFVSSRD